MASSRKTKQEKPVVKVKKPAAKKQVEKKKPAKLRSDKAKPVAAIQQKTPETQPYAVINPLVQDAPAPKINPIDIIDTAGLSTFERIIHFFARHDESDAQKSNVPAKKEDKPAEIDPEALSRGDTPMSFVGHLDEFRSRMMISTIVFVLLTIAGFIFSDELLYYINKPYTDTGLKLNVFTLSEGFMMRLKVSAIAALVIGLPFLMFQVWRFVLPAITKKDRMFFRFALLFSILLFYAGVAFVYFLMMPFTVKMLLSMIAKDITSVINASEYISFVFMFCFMMGVLFEFPIIVMILTRIGLITPYLLSRNRKWAIVIIFILSAVITPSQDMLTQSMVAIPLYGLFEISIVISRFTAVRKKKRELEG